MRYESGVGIGALKVFYTTQFLGSMPILFQLSHIFPFALGIPVFVMSLLGFLTLPYNRNNNVLRLSLLLFFLSNCFLYTNWFRFMAPVFPVMLIFSVLWLRYMYQIFIKVFVNNCHSFIIQQLGKGMVAGTTLLMILPGIAFISIYGKPDIRFTASDWIYSHIPENSYILSETGNVVNLPITQTLDSYPPRQYHVVSFNFYELDNDPLLLSKLNAEVAKAQYIIVPSRRIFANYACVDSYRATCQALKERFPLVNSSFGQLFTGTLGFTEIQEFSSLPELTLFGHTFYQSSEEAAEETWSVFGHPVIRIFQRI